MTNTEAATLTVYSLAGEWCDRYDSLAEATAEAERLKAIHAEDFIVMDEDCEHLYNTAAPAMCATVEPAPRVANDRARAAMARAGERARAAAAERDLAATSVATAAAEQALA